MIGIAGHRGMLGRYLLEAAGPSAVVPSEYYLFTAKDVEMFVSHCNEAGMRAIVNCTGIASETLAHDAVNTNTLLPLWFSRICADYGIGFIHVSTDCVFDGYPRSPGPNMYRSDEEPSPIDPYGWTKALGERFDYGLVVRTSFIGPDHGLMRWALEYDFADGDPIPCYDRVLWSGGHVEDVARALVGIAGNVRSDTVRSVIHLASREPYRKGDIVRALHRARGVDDCFESDLGPFTDRSLTPDIEIPGNLWQRIEASAS